MEKMWGGRFKKKTDPEIEDFLSSLLYDRKLALYDIEASIAHAKMLGKCSIISKKDSEFLVKGLLSLKNKLTTNKIKIDPRCEDIHTAITNLLKKEVGKIADKLHTARSRNDQVVLDVRMYCKSELKEIIKKIKDLQICFLKGAKKFKESTTIPSYTHLKSAQCILFSHQLLAYMEMLERDKERLNDALKRVDIMPLGSAAHRGSTLPIDRFYIAKLLGFSKVSDNSIDSVSDRDFVTEILSDLSILAMHLSRISEDFIIFSSDEFGFVEGDDAHYTGSSMMPHKKNPDPLELIRGYAGTIYGSLFSVLVMMKGLPLTYNRDMQLDKPPLFESIEIIKEILSIFKKVLYGIKIKEDKLKKASYNEFLFAADISEYLVKTKKYSNREAHEIAGKLILKSLDRNKPIKEMPDDELKKFAPELNKKLIRDLLDPLKSVNRIKSYGGASPKSIECQIVKWEHRLK